MKCLLTKVKKSLVQALLWPATLYLCSGKQRDVATIRGRSVGEARCDNLILHHCIANKVTPSLFTPSVLQTRLWTTVTVSCKHPKLQGDQAAMQHRFCSSNKTHPNSHILPNTLHLCWKTYFFHLNPQKTELGKLLFPISFMYCLLSFQHPLQLTWLLGLKGTSSDKVRRRHLEMRRKS